MYLATWKEYHSKLYKFRSVRRNPHTKLYLQRILTLDGGQNSLVSSDMKRVQDFSRTKVFDDIVGDLKIDALYIFDKALTTHHFVVLKMITIIQSLCILWRLNFKTN
jgi:hypothetical protein